MDRQISQEHYRLAKMLEIENELRKYPSEISGGQAQRAALATAFITDSDVILLDEPFSNLNINLAENIFARILCLCREKRKTLVIASHDEWLRGEMDKFVNL
jgi:ABC-type lipoprotein export system ATPase subunit